MTRVPYKALVDTIPDVANGTLDLIFGDATFLLEPGQGGARQADRCEDAQRSPSMPDIPTMQELGFKDFDITAWFAAYAPAGIAARRDRETRRLAEQGGGVAGDESAFLATVATDPMPGTTAQARAS